MANGLPAPSDTYDPPSSSLGASFSIDPESVTDTWSEPWVWRPWEWPGGDLQLSLVENAAPVAVTGTGFENVRPLLFSYGGVTPGPTIRMYGDETLRIELRNLLGLDEGETVVGPNPDPAGLPPGSIRTTSSSSRIRTGVWVSIPMACMRSTSPISILTGCMCVRG